MGWTAVDSGGPIAPITVRFELENDSGGLWWTVYRMYGIQKVRGLNPLGSTNVMSQVAADRRL